MKSIVQYYDQIAGSYDNDRFDNSYGQYIHKQEVLLINKWVNKNNKVILDLPCGTGRLLEFASIGIDASKEMLSIAQQKYPEKKLYIANALETNLPENSIDTIISFHFFMHLDENTVNKVLQEWQRILKPGGKIIFDIPSYKRRKLVNYKSDGWHGGYSISLKELSRQIGSKFSIRRYSGILFFPIHRIPKKLRNLFFPVDRFLVNSFLKEYSSYLVVELIKK